ncbi:TPM domain-containing protein [Frateuria sp. STR12]|uniref:TPM domain-containing protein n=1 Tax=Frateuria hangzhouensis TaxID=2995589 RepID=UPI002260A48F|nr:TPM domain-containing protein [Frateuria sp. STR12]MCX7513487.1 TPM domain-containing protein [Frateuria sp. STR12]
MTPMQRLFANVFGGWFQLRQRFPAGLLDELADAVTAGERDHLGEVRFAVESRLTVRAVLAGVDARTRAQEVFAQLRVWDTEDNSGVLIYLLLSEQRIEIVADRGIVHRVDQAKWDAVCALMRDHFAAGRWRDGGLAGLAAIHGLLREHFPAGDRDNPDELPDRPVLL